MIAKAKAISHGINDIRYITGESQHKKHPEKIYRVLDNLLPSEPVVRVLPGAPVPPKTWWVPAFSLPGGYSAAAALPMSLAGLPFVWHGPFAPLNIFSGKAFRQQPLPFGLSSAAPAGTKK